MFSIRPVRFVAAVAVALLAACAGQNTAPPVTMPVGGAAPALKPSVAIGVKPTKLNFTTSPTLKLTISEAKYTGTFKLTMNPSGIVKLSKSSVKGPKATITVTALNAGKATITATDASKATKAVPVTVTQGVIIIQ